jgi:hypothetical protein
MTPAEVSERYNGAVSVRTLANWRWAGNGPKFTRIGGKILYPTAELEQWEEKRTVEHTSAYKR